MSDIWYDVRSKINEMTVPQIYTIETEFGIIKNAIFKTNENGNVQKKTCPYNVTLLLSIMFGWLGFDRYYLGKTGTGIIKTLTFGGLGIWWLIDIFLILFNRQTDVYGRALDGIDDKDSIVLVYLTMGGIFHYFYLGMYRIGFIRTGLICLFVLCSAFNLFQIAGLLFFIHFLWMLFDLFLVISGRITHDIKGNPIKNSPEKYQSIALLLSFTAGFLGMDRFYLGHRFLGMMKLFTFGGFFTWYIIDLFLIILNVVKDADGNPMIQE